MGSLLLTILAAYTGAFEDDNGSVDRPHREREQWPENLLWTRLCWVGGAEVPSLWSGKCAARQFIMVCFWVCLSY